MARSLLRGPEQRDNTTGMCQARVTSLAWLVSLSRTSVPSRQAGDSGFGSQLQADAENTAWHTVGLQQNLAECTTWAAEGGAHGA